MRLFGFFDECGEGGIFICYVNAAVFNNPLHDLFLDDGLRLLRINAETGMLVGETVLGDHEASTGKELRELRTVMEAYPQVLTNVTVKDKAYADNTAVVAAIAEAERALGGRGRLLVVRGGRRAGLGASRQRHPQSPVRQRRVRAVGELRAEEQEVFLLRQNGQMTYDEIAESIGIPTGTVKTRMRLAITKLRETLAKDKTRTQVFDVSNLGLVDDLAEINRNLENLVAERTAELEASERQSTSIIEQSSDAIIVINGEGKVLVWNSRAERMFGYSTDIRSQTQGRGTFTMSFARYDTAE